MHTAVVGVFHWLLESQNNNHQIEIVLFFNTFFGAEIYLAFHFELHAGFFLFSVLFFFNEEKYESMYIVQKQRERGNTQNKMRE